MGWDGWHDVGWNKRKREMRLRGMNWGLSLSLSSSTEIQEPTQLNFGMNFAHLIQRCDLINPTSCLLASGFRLLHYGTSVTAQAGLVGDDNCTCSQWGCGGMLYMRCELTTDHSFRRSKALLVSLCELSILPSMMMRARMRSNRPRVFRGFRMRPGRRMQISSSAVV